MLVFRLFEYPVKIINSTSFSVEYNYGRLTFTTLTPDKNISESSGFNADFTFLTNNPKPDAPWYNMRLYGLSIKNISDIFMIIRSHENISFGILKFINDNNFERVDTSVFRLVS